MIRVLTLALAVLAFGAAPAWACGGMKTTAAVDGETPIEQTQIPEQPTESNGS